MKKVGIALSGGSAYGYAHIGVLEVLLENNIPIDYVTGTSMGALVGGLFSAGISTQNMREKLSNFSRRKIIDVNPLFLSDGGLIMGKKVSSLLRGMVGHKNIEDCIVPFRAISSNIANGQKYVFESGSLVQAIRASISVPGIFKPVKIGDMVLVDGGLSDNLPIEDARNLGADIVIGVDVCTYYKKQNSLRTMIDVTISSANLIVSNLVKTKEDKGDIYIKIDQPDISFIGFTYKDALKSIEIGRQEALKMLPKIKELLED